MLAQNFMTAAELGLDKRERAALVQVLGMLERGELRHVPVKHDRFLSVRATQDAALGLFNMNDWASESECGTALCIRGTAEAIMRTSFSYPVWGTRQYEKIEDLFMYSMYRGYAREDVAVPQAAQALRNYLTTGEARWAEVLGGAQ